MLEEVSGKAHNLEVGGSNPPSATTIWVVSSVGTSASFTRKMSAVRARHDLPVFLGIVKWYHPTFGTLKRKFDSCYRDQVLIWAVSDNGSTGALHVLGKSSILLRSTKQCGISLMVNRNLAKV